MPAGLPEHRVHLAPSLRNLPEPIHGYLSAYNLAGIDVAEDLVVFSDF